MTRRQRRKQREKAEQQRQEAAERKRSLATGGLVPALSFDSVKFEAPARLPDLTRNGKALGFRYWTLDGYRLLSANRLPGSHWNTGVNKARCLAAEFSKFSMGTVFTGTHAKAGPHEPVHEDCECGLYAWYEVPKYSRASLTINLNWMTGATSPGSSEYVYGAVTAWGRVEAHPTGFRAEYAEPVMLAYDPAQPYQHVQTVQAIAGEMGLPLVELSELAERAAGFGEVIPEDLRPPATPMADLWQTVTYPSFTFGSLSGGNTASK